MKVLRKKLAVFLNILLYYIFIKLWMLKMFLIKNNNQYILLKLNSRYFS